RRFPWAPRCPVIEATPVRLAPSPQAWGGNSHRTRQEIPQAAARGILRQCAPQISSRAHPPIAGVDARPPRPWDFLFSGPPSRRHLLRPLRGIALPLVVRIVEGGLDDLGLNLPGAV